MQHLTIAWQVVAPGFEPPRSCRKFSSAKCRFDSRIMLHARYPTPHRLWCKYCWAYCENNLSASTRPRFARMNRWATPRPRLCHFGIGKQVGGETD